MAKSNCDDCKSYLLSAIPADVWNVILKVQFEEESKKGMRVGKEEIIYRIIRRYAKEENAVVGDFGEIIGNIIDEKLKLREQKDYGGLGGCENSFN